MFKPCSKCREVKPLDSFFNDRSSRDGKQWRCKACQQKYTQAATKRWRQTNRATYQVSKHKSQIKRKYGLGLDELQTRLVVQGGTCGICGRAIEFGATDKINKPHIDHNHQSGAFRGLLCLTCNTGIGMLGDSPELLRAALAYLEAAGQRERLSESTSKPDDAIVRSHGKKNRERLAEMSSPVSRRG